MSNEMIEVEPNSRPNSEPKFSGIRLFIRFLESFGGFCIAGGVIWCLFNAYIDQFDKRLSELSVSSQNYKSSTDEQLTQMVGIVGQMNDSLVSMANDNGDIKSRVVRMETQIEFQTNTLLEGRRPILDGDYIPIQDHLPSVPMGSGGNDLIILTEFRTMSVDIPPPRNETEKQKYAQQLVADHRKFLTMKTEGVSFDENIHDFDVSDSLFVEPDQQGSYKLRLTSSVVLR